MGKHANHKVGKIGRNDPCFCSSGLKYKKCCLLKGVKPLYPTEEVPLEVLEKWKAMRKVTETLQSKGIYINFPNTISWQGKSFLAVGNKLMWDENASATFHQLILRNLRLTFGEEWWSAESAKSEDGRHYIRRCFEDISGHSIRSDQELRQETENLQSFLPTGHMQSLMSLAFDVYVLTHRGYLPRDWLRRLCKKEEYQGVRYEIAVASMFVRMGCELESYDDSGVKPRPQRAEFIAFHPESGNRVAVEAKSRRRDGVIHEDGEFDTLKAMKGDVTKLFNKALKKQTDGLPLMVFIDVNAPTNTGEKILETRWFADIQKLMADHGKPDSRSPSKHNALVVTNFSPHYEGDEVTSSGGYCLIMEPYPEHPFIGGIDGIFIAKLDQSVGGYGFVPNL